jgi:hypothetical protein
MEINRNKLEILGCNIIHFRTKVNRLLLGNLNNLTLICEQWILFQWYPYHQQLRIKV